MPVFGGPPTFPYNNTRFHFSRTQAFAMEELVTVTVMHLLAVSGQSARDP